MCKSMSGLNIEYELLNDLHVNFTKLQVDIFEGHTYSYMYVYVYIISFGYLPALTS